MLARFLVAGFLLFSLLISACGSGGEDGGDGPDAQMPSDRVTGDAAPYQAARAEKAVLVQAAQQSPSEVGVLRDLMDAAANEIGGYWMRTVPQLYDHAYTPPRFVGGYDPAQGDAVICGGQP